MAGLTFVQASNTVVGGVNTISKAYVTPTTASSYLVAMVLTAGLSANAVTVTDTLSNTWTQIGTAITDGINLYNLFQCPSNKVSGGANTVTANVASSTTLMLMVLEWTGQAVSTPLDASTTFGSASTSTVTTPAILGNVTNEQYLLIAWSGNAPGLTPAAGYTTRVATTNMVVLDGFFASPASRTGGYTTSAASSHAVFLLSVKSTTSVSPFTPQAGAFFVGF